MNEFTIILLCALPLLCSLLCLEYFNRKIKELRLEVLSLLNTSDSCNASGHCSTHRRILSNPTVVNAINNARSIMKG